MLLLDRFESGEVKQGDNWIQVYEMISNKLQLCLECAIRAVYHNSEDVPYIRLHYQLNDSKRKK
jgi:hypothetical protein